MNIILLKYDIMNIQNRTQNPPDKNQPTQNAPHAASHEHQLHDEDEHFVESAPNTHDTKSLEMNVHETVPHEDQPSFDQIEPDKNGPGRLGEFELDSEYNKLAWILYPMIITNIDLKWPLYDQ